MPKKKQPEDVQKGRKEGLGRRRGGLVWVGRREEGKGEGVPRRWGDTGRG